MMAGDDFAIDALAGLLPLAAGGWLGRDAALHRKRHPNAPPVASTLMPCPVARGISREIHYYFTFTGRGRRAPEVEDFAFAKSRGVTLPTEPIGLRNSAVSVSNILSGGPR